MQGDKRCILHPLVSKPNLVCDVNYSVFFRGKYITHRLKIFDTAVFLRVLVLYMYSTSLFFTGYALPCMRLYPLHGSRHHYLPTPWRVWNRFQTQVPMHSWVNCTWCNIVLRCVALPYPILTYHEVNCIAVPCTMHFNGDSFHFALYRDRELINCNLRKLCSACADRAVVTSRFYINSCNMICCQLHLLVFSLALPLEK